MSAPFRLNFIILKFDRRGGHKARPYGYAYIFKKKLEYIFKYNLNITLLDWLGFVEGAAQE